ncbi:hypothetical protein AB0L06_43150, partial [Spirillospora sp. NPDC052269]
AGAALATGLGGYPALFTILAATAALAALAAGGSTPGRPAKAPRIGHLTSVATDSALTDRPPR